MPLQPIERGSLASSNIVNDNFEYLDGKITDTASTIQGIDGRLTSQIQTVNNNRANKTLSNVTSLSNEIKALLSNDYATKDLSNVTDVSITGKMTSADKEAITNYIMPDLSRGISVPNLPYTAPSTGWYYTGAIGAVEHYRDIYIDDIRVARWRGGDWTVQGKLIPVYKDGVISGTNSSEAMFYPCRGVE